MISVNRIKPNLEITGFSWNPPAGNPAACGGEEGRFPACENSSFLTIVVGDVWVM